MAWLLVGCGSLLPKPAPPPAYYALQGPAPGAQGQTRAVSVAALPPSTKHTLLVLPPLSTPGYDSARIVYTRQASRLEHFAHSEWVDTPARMLAPLLVAALDRSGAFGAVVQAPSGAAGGLRLETQLLRLQQDFSTRPSRVHLALRAQLLDSRTRRVVATRLFEQVVDSATEDAAGGVGAAKQAVQLLLADLVPFCAQAAAAPATTP